MFWNIGVLGQSSGKGAAREERAGGAQETGTKSISRCDASSTPLARGWDAGALHGADGCAFSATLLHPHYFAPATMHPIDR